VSGALAAGANRDASQTRELLRRKGRDPSAALRAGCIARLAQVLRSAKGASLRMTTRLGLNRGWVGQGVKGDE